MTWIAATEPPLQVAGLPWQAENGGRFLRLPERARAQVRPEIWWLARMPSGGQVRFRSDTTSMRLRVSHTEHVHMWNMPRTGHSGIDLYVGGPGVQRYWTSTTPLGESPTYESQLFAGLAPEMREFTLYLPTYNDLTALQIELSPGARVEPPSPFALDRPVVFYGSSITQGGCASRPGNGYVNTLGRLLNVEVVNQGYSGNGLGEPEVAALLAELDPACYVLDFHCNVETAEGLEQVYYPFYRILREAHPTVPIVMVSMLELPQEFYRPEVREKRLGQTRVIREAYGRAIREGDDQLTFVDGSWLLDAETEGAYVDGVHPTDLGFARMARRLKPILRSVLF
ncbi:SGNH/GDSL hydrolase family protein [Symbiobacterium terraclitae]|uniref:SGNH/GDSL hydrolase family protein n=1 Tax=Symbiobacterium terraclitae TaxID=557451 RepID=UPI0035B507BA